MTPYFVAVCAALGIIVLVVIWLTVEHLKLKREFRILAEHVNNHNRDIAGLCSAAVTVDSRLTGADDLLKNLAEKLSDYEHKEEADQPYHNVIQRVRQGADVAELIQKFGLSRDEAVLLIRLHGDQTQCT
ncbi:MAG: DUF2802 domain-containing protein [Gammaproteobacteria bacterium]